MGNSDQQEAEREMGQLAWRDGEEHRLFGVRRRFSKIKTEIAQAPQQLQLLCLSTRIAKSGVNIVTYTSALSMIAPGPNKLPEPSAQGIARTDGLLRTRKAARLKRGALHAAHSVPRQRQEPSLASSSAAPHRDSTMNGPRPRRTATQPSALHCIAGDNNLLLQPHGSPLNTPQLAPTTVPNMA